MIALMAGTYNVLPIVTATTRTWDYVIDRSCWRVAVNTTTTIAGKDCTARKWNRMAVWNLYKLIETNNKWKF
jgi:hypothetical protein